MSEKIAVYPGSFDPITNGHLDLIYRSLDIFDKVVVAIAVNSEKQGLFSLDERCTLLKQTVDSSNVEVVSFEGLLVDFLKQHNYRTIIRGLRAISDFDYEFQIASMNVNLFPEMDTVFLMTSQKYFYISSSVIKEIARYFGDISEFVSEPVAEALYNKFRQDK